MPGLRCREAGAVERELDMPENAIWWSKRGTALWQYHGPNRLEAEVRQIGEGEFLMSVDADGDIYTGSAARCVDAMREAEGIIRELWRRGSGRSG